MLAVGGLGNVAVSPGVVAAGPGVVAAPGGVASPFADPAASAPVVPDIVKC